MLPKNRQNIDVISLQDSRCQDTKLAGGKGSNLAVMTHIAGLNTKPGWVVTCEFYLTHALSQIQELLISLNNLTEHDDINKTFAKIRSIILNLDITSIDHPLEKELIANVPEQEAEKHYAVRSSANVEDGNLASFSGKFETELYVKKKNLSQAIKRVWASMFTLNNFEYCKENGIKLPP